MPARQCGAAIQSRFPALCVRKIKAGAVQGRRPVQCTIGTEKMKMTEKQIQNLGFAASIMSIGMYVAYIPQIMNNLDGHKGNPVQPFVAFVNCTTWAIYGLFKKQRDWPIVIANVPGIFLGLATFFTAL